MTRFIVLLGACAILIFLSARSASAQAIVFDEYGNITVDGIPSTPGFLPEPGLDPIPGASDSFLTTLTYDLPLGEVIGGDMLVLEPPDFDVDSPADMIRFWGNQIFVFSDDGDPTAGNLADMVPRADWPTLLDNSGGVDQIEGNNFVSWNPGLTGIGSYGTLTLSYTFINDGTTVPEPASGFLAVFSAGLAWLGFSFVRRPARAQARR